MHLSSTSINTSTSTDSSSSSTSSSSVGYDDKVEQAAKLCKVAATTSGSVAATTIAYVEN